MSIEFACATCKKRYKVDEALAGRRVLCKACRSVIRIPDVPPDIVAPEPAPLTLDDVPAGTPVAPPPLAVQRPASAPGILSVKFCTVIHTPL